MSRHLTIVSWLCIATACTNGAGGLPSRTSPELEQVSSTPQLQWVRIRDARRDGVYTDGDGAVIVRRLDGDVSSELFRVEVSAVASLVRLASRADDDVVIVIPVQDGASLYRWDGASLADLSARMQAALITEGALWDFQVTALDYTDEGTIVFGAAVDGEGAPHAQVCTLGPSGDACDGVELATDDPYPRVDAVAAQGELVYASVEGRPLRRALGGGVWSELEGGGVAQLFAIEGGRIGIVQHSGEPYGKPTLTVLRADGSEERRFEEVSEVYGHSARGLWTARADTEGDGSCTFSWGSCSERSLWTQLVVTHLIDAEVEVGHRDYVPGRRLDMTALALGDGSLRIETTDGVYVVPAP